MSTFQCDPKTLESIMDLLGSAALSAGASATVTIPAVALGKLAARLSDAGVDIPNNAALTALQEAIRNQAELPGEAS